MTFEQAIRGAADFVPSTDPIWARITHPETYDPANYLVPTALGPLLESDNRPVVAVIPDDLIMAAHYSVRGNSLNTSAFEVLVENSCQWVEQDGMRILRPTNPHCSDRYDCDRASLGTALRRFLSQGNIDLKGWSRLAYEQELAFPMLPRQFVKTLEAQTISEFVDMSAADEFFQVLGAVPDDKWDALELGTDIAVTSEEVRSKLWGCMLQNRMDLGNGKALSEIDLHPTELFPNGIPMGARVVAHSSLERAFRSPGDTRQVGTWDIDLLAWTKARFESMKSGANHSRQSTIQSGVTLDEWVRQQTMTPCMRLTFTTRFDLSAGLGISGVFRGKSNVIGPASHFADLPEDFRKAAYEEWTRLEQAAAQTLVGPGGAGGN